jgi:hypothetical protein
LLSRGKSLERAHTLILISLYETRLRRAVEKEIAALEAMQTKRKEAYSRAQDEATRLAQLAASEGEKYDPGEDFVPPRPMGSSFFRGPIRSAFWTAATASAAPGTSTSALHRSPKPPKDANLTKKLSNSEASPTT